MSTLGAEVAPAVASIVVVGSVNVDTVLRVEHLPHPGETIAATSTMERNGGKGANQAVYAAALLPGVALVGCVGDDDRGGRALVSLENAGVDHSRVLAQRGPTGTATVVVDEAGENSIVLAAGANALVSAEAVSDAISTLAAPESIVLVCLEIPDAAVEAAAHAAARVGARLILNPAPGRPMPDSVLRHCHLVVPNAVELGLVTAAGTPEAIFAAGAGGVVVTRGGAGAEIHYADGSSLVIDTPQVRVLDTTGAGDAFVAALTVAIHDGRELEDAVRMAVGAGAIAVTGPGGRGAIPTRARIAELTGQPSG